MIEQQTRDWLEKRKYHIGSSDISCIMGNNPWKSAYICWLEKTGKKELPKPNKAMLHGQYTEPFARDLYSEITQISMMPNVLFHKDWEVAMASLDGISPDRKRIVEIKCPLNPKLYMEAKKELIPPYYYDQMQWQLMISKAEKCDFFVYLSKKENTIVTISSDNNYQQTLFKKATKFWELVLKNTPPPREKTEAEYVESRLSNELAKEVRYWKEIEIEAKGKREFFENELRQAYEGKKCFFPEASVHLNWIQRAGSIDWRKLQKEMKISEEQLEVYRKKPITYSQFSILSE